MTPHYDVLLTGPYFCDMVFNGLPEMPQLGRDVFSSSFDMVAGGVFYTAQALHRLGVLAGWKCNVGNDLFSRFIIESAQTEGMDTALFQHHERPLRRIAAAFSFAHDRGFVSYIDDLPDILPLTEIAQYQPRCLFLSHIGYWQTLSTLANLPQRQHMLVYMDCQDTTLTLETPGLVEALACVDVFAPNETEALHLTGETAVSAALGKLADIVPTAVIKLGSKGAIAQRGGEVIAVPPIAITPVDTTGAGDCFNAGFIYGLLQNASLADCLRYGNIVGGLATTNVGGTAVPAAPLDLQTYFPKDRV
ncbi:MAG: carbohydrate kinase family protein [Anaerolineae bacterium]|nr:carbohydrate kinase family protein [Anaerolineae bacterium]